MLLLVIAATFLYGAPHQLTLTPTLTLTLT